MSAANYINYLFLDEVWSHRFDEMAGNKWIEDNRLYELFCLALANTIRDHGYTTRKRYDDIVRPHFEEMKLRGAISEEGDDYTGKFLRLNVSEKDEYCRVIVGSDPIRKRIEMLGEAALDRAMLNVAQEEKWTIASPEGTEDSGTISEDVFSSEIIIPASDRIVTLGHNQISSLVSGTEELTELIEQTTNEIDGDSGLRSVVIGQLKATKELLLNGVFKLDIMRLMFLDTLAMLAKRYEKEAIGALASALLAELVKAIAGA